MKKIEYLTPETDVVELKLAQIICASDGTSGSASLSDEEETGDPD